MNVIILDLWKFAFAFDNDGLIALPNQSFVIKVKSAGDVEYTDTSAKGLDTPNECPDMTLNNLMVRFQSCWGFGEYEAPIHCHCSLEPLRPGIVAPDRDLPMI